LINNFSTEGGLDFFHFHQESEKLKNILKYPVNPVKKMNRKTIQGEIVSE